MKNLDYCDQLEIRKMPEGGYIVASGRSRDEFGCPGMAIFAATSIKTALDFMRVKLTKKIKSAE